MNKIYTCITLIFVTSLLTACQNSIFSENASNLVLNNKKAVILYSANTNGLNVDLRWDQIDKNSEVIEQAPLYPNEYYIKGLWSTVFIANMITPGKYTLSEIIYGSAGENSTYTTLSVSELMEFSIAPGEVVYLGHLAFQHKESWIKYRVEDRFEADYETMQGMLPILYSKIQKRLIK